MSHVRYVLLVVTTLVLVGVTAFAVDLPHSFTAGTTIRASDVNANFAALAAALPLVAHAHFGGQVIIPTTTAPIDVITVTLSVPIGGTVIVAATGQGGLSASTEPNHFTYSIDTVPGGVLDTGSPDAQVFGFFSPPSSSAIFGTVAIQRAFDVAPGTHTFRLKAFATGTNGFRWVYNPTIVATFYPTGQVAAVATTPQVAVVGANGDP
jgi:hypothetical protein